MVYVKVVKVISIKKALNVVISVKQIISKSNNSKSNVAY